MAVCGGQRIPLGVNPQEPSTVAPEAPQVCQVYSHQHWESNSSLHAYAASAMPTEPSSKSPDFFEKKKKIRP